MNGLFLLSQGSGSEQAGNRGRFSQCTLGGRGAHLAVGTSERLPGGARGRVDRWVRLHLFFTRLFWCSLF